MSVQHGVLTLNGVAGLAFSVGDGVGDPTMTFTGSVADINAALSRLFYRGDANYNGPDAITITTNDNGNTGSGGPQSATKTITLDVQAINDAPTATNLTQALIVGEDAAATTLFTVAPVVADIDSANVTATLTVSAAAGVLVGAGTGVLNAGVLTYTITGTAAAVNTALAAVTFDSAADFSGATNVGVTISDGANGPQGVNPTGTVSITVNPVNDAPTATNLTQSLTINEDAAATTLFTAAPVVADIDSANVTATLTVDAAAGVLNGAGAGVLNARRPHLYHHRQRGGGERRSRRGDLQLRAKFLRRDQRRRHHRRRPQRPAGHQPDRHRQHHGRCGERRADLGRDREQSPLMRPASTCSPA